MMYLRSMLFACEIKEAVIYRISSYCGCQLTFVIIMGLVTILVFLGLLGELKTTPIKFLFDVDPSEISGRVAPSPSNPGRQTRRLSSMVRSEAGHNGAELVRYDEEQISTSTQCHK